MAEKPQPKPVRGATTRGGAMIVVSLMAGYSIVYMDKSMISLAIMPIGKQFGFNTVQTGLIMSFFFLGYALMQIPCGWLADKIGAKKVLVGSLAFIAVFAFFFGAMGGLVLFIAMRFFMGFGHGGYPPSVTKSIAENFPQKKRTFVQSLILSTSGIGGILAFTLGGALIDMNWRMAYAVLGSLYLVAVILIWFFVPSHGGNAQSQQKVEAGAAAGDLAAAADAPKVGFKDVLKNRNVVVLFIAMVFINIMLYGQMSWMPTYIKNTFQLSTSQTGLLLAFNSIFTMLSTIFSGSLLSKLFLGRERIAIIGASLLTSVIIVAFTLFGKNSLVLSMILLALMSLVAMFAFTGIFTWPHKIMNPKIIGSSIAVINTGGTIGGFLAPTILGNMVKASGGSFTSAFMFLALMTLLCAVVVLFVKPKSQAATK
ncbi:sugar phosphate permease [Bifidobacterium commune]|uniref:Sugar phosphate permease n=1 Tax=Bifidobacterium commune TaxID=1505727 RepID=A0A1C4H2S2_9BIFI|nr:MFS transporter [Bifidobacterium commune]MBB2954979.1 sugar phosphate permease [Bifidobacterium commune]SCC79176.1 Sugar phosphate permease [Bifidobacterium commune]